jgi:transcriptional regulator with XRE-family HTH domain
MGGGKGGETKTMSIGERIKKLRLDKRKTQSWLAKESGTTKQTIYKYEAGVVTNIPIERFRAIATALQVSLDHLTENGDTSMETKIDLSEVTTRDLIDELAQRNGVQARSISPHIFYRVTSETFTLVDDGPATILVIMD